MASLTSTSTSIPEPESSIQSESQPKPQLQPSSDSKPPNFTLLLFASASTYCNDTSQLSLPAPTTLFKLFCTLEELYPGIGTQVLRSSQVVVNFEYVECDVEKVCDAVLRKRGGQAGDGKEEGDDVEIVERDEVAVVPPVSSG